MESSQHHPQRLSALYQYHNAPEVAPAHGLEYDDTVYPSSDKYPVLHNSHYAGSNGHYTGKHALDDSNRPPRIIFGMKVRTFLVVAVIFVLIIVGAAVGGAVGGKSVRSNNDGLSSDGSGYSSSTTSTALPSATSTGFPSSTSGIAAAATPTFAPLSDCQNNTVYTSTFASGSSGTAPPTAGLNFTKYCDASTVVAQKIAEAFVYTFDDCIEVCAGYNFWGAGSNCTVAMYIPSGQRPGNCWVGNANVSSASAGLLSANQGTDTALLT